ncbi:MAG TPA: CPBP family intramembrane glutamic endopeptidase [Terracidiphilus sp.]|jgi:hypothetical protein
MQDAPTNPIDVAIAAPEMVSESQFAAGSVPAAVPPPPPPRPRRIPNFGDLAMLGLLLAGGFICTIVFIFVAIYLHLFGVARIEDAMHSMGYAIGTMLVWYAIAFTPALFIFPAFWHRKLADGLQWNAAVPRRRWPWLMAAGASCLLLAVGAKALLHFPEHSPLEGLLSTPQAIWIMFAFAITLAPLCEETLFRGFMLPALCTAFDWTGEKITHRPAPALLAGNHPRWSLPAMIFSSAITSAIFAVFHMSQNGKAIGPLALIFTVSLVLCAVRLATRSLAASTLTHATYNCTLFVVQAIGSHGFTHLHR